WSERANLAAGVIPAVLPRPFLCALRPQLLFLPAKDAAQQASENLSPELPAHGAGGRFGHRLDHSLSLFGAPENFTQSATDPRRGLLGGATMRRLPRRRRRLSGRCLALGQHFIGRFAIHAGIILAADRAA